MHVSSFRHAMRTQTPTQDRKTRATKKNKQLIDIVKF